MFFINEQQEKLFIETDGSTKHDAIWFVKNDDPTRENMFRFINEYFTSGRINDFKVVCDESNNTKATIDNNELHVEIFIVPYEAWFYDDDEDTI